MTTLNPVLDWHPPSENRKEANQPYRLFAQLELEKPKDLNLHLKVRSRFWKRKLWLDQGKEGACTGFALAHCLGIGGKYWPLNDQHAFTFYQWAKLFDQWAGEDYEGSSVQGACEGAKDHGIIDGYWWIETPAEFEAAVSRYGALDLGTWWKSGMWTPDSKGLIHNTGSREGGHSYSVGGIDYVRRLARIDNSWGKNKWGYEGSAWMDLDELYTLLFEERGECALIRKKKYNPNALVLPQR